MPRGLRGGMGGLGIEWYIMLLVCHREPNELLTKGRNKVIFARAAKKHISVL